MKRLYFDNAATTQVDPRVFKAMSPYFGKKFGNPSSVHSFGQEASKAVEEAREKVARFLGARLDEIIFTSGATESDNLAIKGVAKALKKFGGHHIITSAIEHPAVIEACQSLENAGFELSIIPVDQSGILKLPALKKAIKKETFLITLMFVNNEIGAIQPIKKVGQYMEGLNKIRAKNGLNRVYFHTDAVQAVNLFDCRVKNLGVDLLSISGHKIYGPKGVGALYVKKGTPMRPIQHGGHHEFGLRPGTINTPLITGLGKAIELVKGDRNRDFKKFKKFERNILKKVLEKIPKSRLNGDPNRKSPAIVNITFDNVEGESLLLMLDMMGIAISTGSACASGSLEPSAVLKAMGLSDEKCHGSIRISLGRENRLNDINYFLKILPGLVKKLRERSPL